MSIARPSRRILIDHSLRVAKAPVRAVSAAVGDTAELLHRSGSMRFGQGVSAETIAILLSIGGAAAGVATHYLLERPATSCARRILDFADRFAPNRRFARNGRAGTTNVTKVQEQTSRIR